MSLLNGARAQNNTSHYFKLLLLFSSVQRRRAVDYMKEHKEAESDVSGYLSNPINAYLLTKRLTSDWKSIEAVMTYDVGSGRDFL